MRYIPAKNLKPGQRLARDLMVDRSRVLIRRGMELTEPQIGRVRMMGFPGVLVDDMLSLGIKPNTPISEDTRLRAHQELRKVFDAVQRDTGRRAQDKVLLLEPIAAAIIADVQQLGGMANMLDIRSYEEYTYSHCINVAAMGVVLGAAMGLDKRQLRDLALGGLVHDVGQLFVDGRIINKQSKLSIEEFEEVKRHTVAGFNYFSASSALSEATKAAILSHHEQFNGTGYPSGTSGNDIPLTGRILGVADVYDALLSERPYRHAMLPVDAAEYIMSGYNTRFDPMVVDAFVRRVAPYPEGTCVLLSDDRRGIVLENFESASLRPKLRLIGDDGQTTSSVLDLTHAHAARNISIVGVAPEL